MISTDILTKDHIDKISEILSGYGLTLDKNLILTPNPGVWARDKDIQNIKIWDIAFSTIEHPSERKLIIFSEIMPYNSIRSILSRIDFSIGTKRCKKLDSPESFIIHLTLHEIAHLVKKMTQEEEEKADDWAAKEMGI